MKAIYLIAPSGANLDPNSPEVGIAYLQSQGTEISNAQCVHRVHERFAGTDAERSNELNGLATVDPKNLVMAMRGGYGIHRLLPDIAWNTISKAVKNSYLDPIVASFDIKAWGKDSASSIIDVTDFFKGDNQAVSLTSFEKRMFGLSAIASDRSYVESIKTYPINIEVKTVKTFNASSGSPMGGASPMSAPSIPAAMNAGAVTFELNTSMSTCIISHV